MINKWIAILKILVVSILIIVGFYAGMLIAIVLSPILIGGFCWLTYKINNEKGA
jgi:hypothetical protein